MVAQWRDHRMKPSYHRPHQRPTRTETRETSGRRSSSNRAARQQAGSTSACQALSLARTQPSPPRAAPAGRASSPGRPPDTRRSAASPIPPITPEVLPRAPESVHPADKRQAPRPIRSRPGLKQAPIRPFSFQSSHFRLPASPPAARKNKFYQTKPFEIDDAKQTV